MAKNLLIVESPAKAKTIEKFLGKDFTVRSSIGHIRDLPEKGIGVDVKNNFAPEYVVSPDKKKVVSELKKLAKAAETVWLATDEDREGEAIAWHLLNELGLDESKTKRVVYHEITKSAIENAIKHPRTLNRNLVDAQQARRILDRLVGYELSPILWRKIKPALSAGRVQSVSVRLIVEREREINAFILSPYYKVVGMFEADGIKFKAELEKRLISQQDAEGLLNKLKGANFVVKNQEKKPSRRSPSAPFTTSTLQQEASRKLSFSVSQTMRVAQSLYERGDITYMRTDSVNLSQVAIDGAKNEVKALYGDKYAYTRIYKTKSASAQEAHEAIRPTHFSTKEIEGTDQEKRLYDLIWKRTVASQMADAEIEKTILTISNNKSDENFIATGEVIIFEGFLKVYNESEDDIKEENAEGQLPMLKTSQVLQTDEINAIQRFTIPPARYTEASLVKKLEALGIGRPSTYAPTISTIQKRGYVVKESREGTERKYNVFTLKNGQVTASVKTEITGAEKAKLFPTDVGIVVNDFLIGHFAEIMDYNFTAHVEEEFDVIADGRLSWTKMLENFYKPFHKTVEKTSAEKERASGERLLGQDPATGKNVYVKIGRYGPMVQVGDTESEEKPRFAKLRAEQRMESITLDEALDLCKLPRNIGKFEDVEMSAAIGRFGPYIKHGAQFYSIPSADSPYTITQERAIELIQTKRISEKEKTIQIIKHEPEIKILKGRYGPYMTMDKKNYKIPKDKDPANLTLEECLAILEEDKKSGNKKRRFTPRKKKPVS